MNTIPCSAALLTLNSESTLRACLESLASFDDIVLLDGGSTDRTRTIAEEFDVRVFPQAEGQRPNARITNFTEVRKKSFALSRYPWVFYIDSDEYLSPELRGAIARAVARNDAGRVYAFRRVAVVEGVPCEHAFFYPEYSIRLINRESGVHWKEGAVVHEHFEIPSPVSVVNFNEPLYAIWPAYRECKEKDNYYLSLATLKFTQNIGKFSWPRYLRSVYINLAKAANCARKIFLIYLRYGTRRTMPWKYQWRFVRYHLLMALSREKFFAVWKKSRSALHTT